VRAISAAESTLDARFRRATTSPLGRRTHRPEPRTAQRVTGSSTAREGVADPDAPCAEPRWPRRCRTGEPCEHAAAPQAPRSSADPCSDRRGGDTGHSASRDSGRGVCGDSSLHSARLSGGLGWQVPKHDEVPSGRLTLSITNVSHMRHRFSEVNRPLEQMLNRSLQFSSALHSGARDSVPIPNAASARGGRKSAGATTRRADWPRPSSVGGKSRGGSSVSNGL
jgi:hypothetical protein